MGVLDAPLRQVASAIIRPFGSKVTLKFVNNSAYNPTTGEQEERPEDQQVFALIKSWDEQLDGSLQKLQGLSVVIAFNDLTVDDPELVDRIQVHGDWYNIMSIDPITSGYEIAAYSFNCAQ